MEKLGFYAAKWLSSHPDAPKKVVKAILRMLKL